VYVTVEVENAGNMNEGESMLAFRAIVFLQAVGINWVAYREDCGISGGISYGNSGDACGDKESHDSAREE